jgi:hypothetical protein
LNAGAWLRRVRFVIISPVPRHHRRVQAEIPLIPVFEFGQPLLPAALKRAIVAACMKPGASLSVVARQYDVNTNMVFTWRKLGNPPVFNGALS